MTEEREIYIAIPTNPITYQSKAEHEAYLAVAERMNHLCQHLEKYLGIDHVDATWAVTIVLNQLPVVFNANPELRQNTLENLSRLKLEREKANNSGKN
jgi:hypothetical protein